MKRENRLIDKSTEQSDLVLEVRDLSVTYKTSSVFGSKSVYKAIDNVDLKIKQGEILGLVGAAIPRAAIYVIYKKAIEYLVDRFAVLDSLLQFLSISEIFTTLVPASLILGAGIGFLGSFVTARKHIRV